MPTKGTLDFINSKDSLQYPDKKASKPLMEKRRRARINHSLAQLKSLIIDPNTTEKSRQSKLEKADILELTVRHLHEIKRRQRTVSLLEGRNPTRKFEIGYTECAREVDLFLSSLVESTALTVNSELHTRLTQHLSRRLHDLKNIDPVKEVSPCDTEDTSITSSSFTKNTEVVPPELCNPPELNIPEKEQFYKLYTSECDTTATNLTTSTTLQPSNSDTSSLCYLREQNVGHSQVSSSSMESSVVFDESNSYHSTSSSPSVFEPKELSRSIVFDHYEGQAKMTSESFFNVDSAINEKMTQTFKQIALVPKHLPNGEWALVLPQDITENEVQTFSAFRLVLPSTFPDPERERLQSDQSPNTSSSVSELNSGKYFFRASGEPSDSLRFRENFENNSDSQCVWRPW